ncbi:MAG: DUF501 domain-containing protein [Bacillota bacterium]
MKLSEERIIEIQLKRKINNFIETICYCPFSYPAVVLVDPFKNNIPAPTIYWLTCPYLTYEVDRVEADTNLIKKSVEKLNENCSFRKAMDSAHKNYAEKRLELLDNKKLKKAELISEDLLATLKFSGVGGIKDKHGIKCLHTHLAHYLAGGDNPVGRIVFNKIQWPQNCKICSERIDKLASSSN